MSQHLDSPPPPSHESDSPIEWSGSIVGIVARVVRSRRILMVGGLAGATVLVAAALLSPRTYTSISVLVPEVQPGGAGGLGGLASRFGVSLPFSGSERSLQFYAALARSRAVASRVVDSPLNSGQGGTVSTRLVDVWRIEGATDAERRERAIARFSRILRVSTDLESSALTIAVSVEDAYLARATLLRVIAVMDSLNIEARMAQASAERVFLGARLSEAKVALEESERLLASFVSRNRTYDGDPGLRIEFDRLQREVQGRQTIWIGLAQDFERARLGEVRNTPSIIPVEPPTLPALADRRSLFLRLLLGFTLGALSPLVVIFFRSWWREETARDHQAAVAFRRALSRNL